MGIYLCLRATSLLILEIFKFKVLKRDFQLLTVMGMQSNITFQLSLLICYFELLQILKKLNSSPKAQVNKALLVNKGIVKTCLGVDMVKNKSFQLLYLESRFLSVAYLTVANLARRGISVHCQVSVRSQYLVRILSQCWITVDHTIHPPIKGLLSPSGIEPTPFQNSVSKVAGLQVHATARHSTIASELLLLAVGCITSFRLALVHFESLTILEQPKDLNVFNSYGNSYHGAYIKETKKRCFCFTSYINLSGVFHLHCQV